MKRKPLVDAPSDRYRRETYYALPVTDVPSPFAKGLICKARDLISECAKG